ncbi:flavin reductase family protein [Pseudomonas sp. W4I3]|uniref:flavin reductase family protein n=1 Tax=Pseudomonas sp. W4I3 TaxID=3042294 RepID=UPI00278AE22F|nr:flavin reductase family protein [Pseudomonas sp. W4I3]MDQ0740482.1 flavin reductase (DIM6/NTAB) family NADH-FMN oxidoreductase RutF [Pseudomonas sp. W4I3]
MQTLEKQLDKRALRNAYGKYATGVTVVTTLDDRGLPAGLTVSSFNSVSLEPALVLWSLRKESYTAAAFQAADGFAINVLAYEQQLLSDRFATPTADKFSQVHYAISENQLPLIDGAIAQFECIKRNEFDGGDHWIFIGEVISFTLNEGSPLIFHGGKYATAV